MTSLGRHVGFGFSDGLGPEHALLWNNTFSNATDLHPASFNSSIALGVFRDQQVGQGYPFNSLEHALLWHGSRESLIDLHPAGFAWSMASATHDGHQVGAGDGKALLWRGSAGSVVILHPTNYEASAATCVTGMFQGGRGNLKAERDYNHALLWKGSRGSMIDLHPPRLLEGRGDYPYYHTSIAEVSCNGEAIGYGTLPCTFPSTCFGPAHALLWLSGATNYIDLHPVGFANSYGTAMFGKLQAGYGSMPGGHSRALLWSGSRETVVNLHSFLPARFIYSQARGIDEFGNIFGVAGTRVAADGSDPEPVLWVPQFGNGVEHYLRIAPLCPVGGRIEIQLAGVVGARYTLEKSEDLFAWRPVGTFTLSNPLQVYEEPAVERTLNGFFRSVMVGAPGGL